MSASHDKVFTSPSGPLTGQLSQLNTMAESCEADYVICIGDLGFYDRHSAERLPKDKLLPEPKGKHLEPSKFDIIASFSALLRASPILKEALTLPHTFHATAERLGDFPYYLSGERKFKVPVYATYGSVGDINVICKLRSGEYKVRRIFLLARRITLCPFVSFPLCSYSPEPRVLYHQVPNFHLVDEKTSHRIGALRLFGLGGAFVHRHLLDIGEGTVDSLAGGHGQ